MGFGADVVFNKRAGSLFATTRASVVGGTSTEEMKKEEGF